MLANQAETLLASSDLALSQEVQALPRGAGAGAGLGCALSREQLEDSGKLRAILRLLAKHPGEKALLFSQFIEGLDLAERVLRGRGARCWRIDGATEIMQRQAIIDDFSRARAGGAGGAAAGSVMLLTTRTGGVGLNLAAASVVIFLDIDWSAQVMLQAEDRAHRMGQTRPVFVYRLLLANSFEGYMQKVADAKAALSLRLLRRAEARASCGGAGAGAARGGGGAGGGGGGGGGGGRARKP